MVWWKNVLVVLICIGGCMPVQTYVYQVPEDIGDGLSAGKIDDVGMEAATVEQAVDLVRRGRYREVHSLLIVKDGLLVFEEYFPGHRYKYNGRDFLGEKVRFDRENLHNLASVTKSFTSAAAGIAIARGDLAGIDEPVFSFFPEFEQLKDDRKQRITVEHLLTMTSGLKWNEWDFPYGDKRNDLLHLYMADDCFEYILAKEAAYEPGTHWYYSGGDVNLLAEILKRACGMRMDEYLARHLFEPMGITEYQWQFIKPGIIYASGDLKLRPRDMAKFGLLHLQGGRWNGQQLIPQQWIEQSIARHVKLDRPVDMGSTGYGYQWFMRDYQVGPRRVTAVRRTGWGGQAIVLFPSLDMLVVTTGGNYVSIPDFDNIIEKHILPAVR